MPGTLSIVATPIGHLQDITLRALATLEASDVIVCEDTRVTSKLLAAHGISKPLRPVHEHTNPRQIDAVIGILKEGKRVSYVTDAGTPGMNDPGGRLVDAAMREGIRVEPIPGPSALTAAISICGFPMDEFAYHGFVPHKKGRQTLFREIAADPRPSVILESTHRIMKTLEALRTELDPRRLIFVGRELTKIHESVHRGTTEDVIEDLKRGSLKGEFVVIVGPRPKR